ncbi:hypothetical protein D3C75_904190 [compost metagenome]
MGNGLFLLRQRKLIEETLCFADGQRGDVGNVLRAYRNRQNLRLQAVPLTLGAGFRAHKLFDKLADTFGSRIPVPALQVRDDALEGNHGVLALAKIILILEPDPLSARSVHNDLHLFGGKIPYRYIHGNAVMTAGGSQKLGVVGGGAASPSGKRSVLNGFFLIGHQKIRVHNHLHAQTVTFRTSAEGAVEGEHPGG